MYRSKMQVRLSDVYHDFTSVIGENVRAVALGKIRKVLEQKEGGGGSEGAACIWVQSWEAP